MARYLLRGFVDRPDTLHPSVKDVDIYLINAAGTWSLIHPGEKLDPVLAERVIRDHGGE